MLRRASSTGIDEPRCVNWTGTQLILWLATHAPDTVDEADDKAEMERLSPTSAAAESPEDTAGQVRWKNNSMLILLGNCLAHLKSDFLERDATVSRAILDAKETDWF